MCDLKHDCCMVCPFDYSWDLMFLSATKPMRWRPHTYMSTQYSCRPPGFRRNMSFIVTSQTLKTNCRQFYSCKKDNAKPYFTVSSYQILFFSWLYSILVSIAKIVFRMQLSFPPLEYDCWKQNHSIVKRNYAIRNMSQKLNVQSRLYTCPSVGC